MEPVKPTAPGPGSPITEADLHAWVDQQLTPVRHAEVEQYLSTRADESQRVRAWRQQNEALRAMLAPVLDEPLPLRLPLLRAAPAFPWRGLAAGVMLAVVSASAAWFARGEFDRDGVRSAMLPGSRPATAAATDLTGFALRAAVAHVVYTPEVRRPVEVGADQEQQLVTWLSKRLGATIKAPSLRPIGYDLIGGRLLPGESGPVAQFMYRDEAGQRLTIYVTREAPKPGSTDPTAFRFGRDGPVNVFYWVDRSFGYAISGAADRAELMRVSQEVYRQLAPG